MQEGLWAKRTMESSPTVAETNSASLHRAALRLMRQTRRQDGRIGLGPAQSEVLGLLADHSPLSVKALAEMEGVAHPTMSRILTTLAQRELVVKLNDPADGRAQLAAITDRGYAAYREAYHWREEVLARLVARLSPRSAQELLQALEVVAQEVEEDRKRRPK